MFCDFNRLFLRRQHSNYDIPPAIDLKSIYLSIYLPGVTFCHFNRPQPEVFSRCFVLSLASSLRDEKNPLGPGYLKSSDGRRWKTLGMSMWSVLPNLSFWLLFVSFSNHRDHVTQSMLGCTRALHLTQPPFQDVIHGSLPSPLGSARTGRLRIRLGFGVNNRRFPSCLSPLFQSE